MTTAPIFNLRPLERREPDGLLDGAFRIHISIKEIKGLGIEAGGSCQIKSSNGIVGVGVAWPSVDTGGSGAKRIVKVSDFFRGLYGFNLQDRVSISECTVEDIPIESIEVAPVNEEQPLEEFSTPEELQHRVRTVLG